MSADVVIRRFEPRDLPRLHDIRNAAFRPIYASFREILGPDIAPIAFAGEEDLQGKHLDEICAEGSAHEVFIAEADGQPVGFVALSVDERKRVGELGLNAVHPDHAGKGVGAALYKLALDRMREQGMEIAVVGTGGDPSHAPARRAYEKAGFGPGIPTLWLYKRL